MKIGVFTDSYKPYTSGVVTSITTFKQELTSMGHDIYIFAPSYPHYEEEEDKVYRFYSLPAPTNPDYTLAIPVYPGLNMLLKKIDLDIIHVHSPFTMGRVGLHYARKYDLPIVFTYHTLYDQYVHYVPVAQELARDITIRYSTNFCNQCDHVIVPSTEVEAKLKDLKVKTPISVIPTGVPVHKFKHGDNTWLRRHYPSISEKNKILLFVGRLTREKNLEFLIEAFSRLKKEEPATTLVLTAQGPLEHELKKLVKELNLSLERDVVFTGALPFDTLINVYHSADIFVFASLTETQGLVLIEAMAAGLPVVAVKANGVIDMVDDGVNGFLTPCDKEAFAGAIKKLLADEKLYNSFKSQAYKKAAMLSSASMARKLEKVYQDLCERTRPKRRRKSYVMDLLYRLGS